MKKSLYAIVVILLSLIGANAIAAKLDQNVERAAVETNDKTGGDNGRGRGGGNAITREK